jgi:hypothetical protein
LIAAGLLALCTQVNSAAAQQAPATAPAFQQFKAIAIDPDQSPIERNVGEYRKTHPQIGVSYSKTDIGIEKAIEKLLAGEADFITLPGPQVKDNRKADWLLPLLEKEGCKPFVFGWQVMAIVVHPSNERQEIGPNDLDVKAQLFGEVETDPNPKQYPGTYLADERLNRAIRESSSPYWRYFRVQSHKRQLGLNALAHNRQGVAMMCLDDRLAASGLKILPFKPEPGSPAVLPTPKNMTSGAYPYYSYSLLATRPNAPAELLAMVEYFKRVVHNRRFFIGDFWVPELVDLEIPAEQEFYLPAPGKLEMPANIAGAVAVLPFEASNSLFLAAEAAHHAAVEQSITAVVSKQPGMKMVDRAYLQQVLDEQQRRLAPVLLEKPLLAADLLVSSSFVTVGQHTYVVIDAVQGVNGCLVGQLRVPIDPAQLDEIEAILTPRIAQWWPGVLARLQQVRTLPVWAIRVTHEPADQSPEEELVASIHKTITQTPEVFLAEYQSLTAARRELILGLLGITAAKSGRFTPAADYLVELDRTAPEKPVVRLLHGADLRLLEEHALASRAWDKPAVDWLQAHLRSSKAGRLSQQMTVPLPDKPTSMQAQADLEYQRGTKLRAEYEAYQNELYEKRRANNGQENSPEEQKKLAEYASAIAASFQRAAQLDPTRAQVSYEEIMAKQRAIKSNYNSYKELATASGMFVDMFPNSPHIKEVLQQAFQSNMILVRFLRETGLTNTLNIPAGVEVGPLRLQHQRDLLRYLAELNERCAADVPNNGVLLKVYRVEVARFRELGGGDAEITQAIARYGRTFDKLPLLAAHSDFLRLDQFAVLGDRKSYLALLKEMQARAPKPDDPLWNVTAEDTLDQICELMVSDPRATGFYWWLRGKGEPAILP